MLVKQEDPFRPILPKAARATIIGHAPADELYTQDSAFLKHRDIAFYERNKRKQE